MTSIVAPPQFSIEGTTSHSMHPTEGTTLSPSSLSLFIYNQSKMNYYIHVAPPQFKIEGTTSHSMHPTEGTSLHPPPLPTTIPTYLFVCSFYYVNHFGNSFFTCLSIFLDLHKTSSNLLDLEIYTHSLIFLFLLSPKSQLR